MSITDAIALLTANGYRVSKARPKRTAAVPALNAIGRPYGPNYDPHYKIKTPLTSIARLRAPQSGIRFVQEDGV